ncbi:MAG: hypothetical protein SVR94_09390 [Pseudomonadota bacterium]|nr:hypothetical protein [Pseudomonadota bacterium]
MNPWVKMIMLFLGLSLSMPAVSQKQMIQQQLAQSNYQSIHELAQYGCLPCHYGPKGTALQPLIKKMNEAELAAYLTMILTQTQMPPDKVFREILTHKLNTLKKQLTITQDDER